MNWIENEVENTRAELVGGSGLGVAILIGAFLLLAFQGCSNTRFSCQWDDLGETASYDQTFKAQKRGVK